MRKYQVARSRGSLIHSMGKRSVQFNAGNILPSEVVEDLEKKGELRRLMARGLIIPVGAGEVPKVVKEMRLNPAGNTTIGDLEQEPVIDQRNRPPQEDVVRPPGTTFDSDVNALGVAIRQEVEGEGPGLRGQAAAHPTGAVTSPWVFSPQLLETCNLQQLTAVIKSKDPQAPEFTDSKSAIRFMCKDWNPPTQEEKTWAEEKGYIESPEQE